MAFVEDTFTEASDTNLENHTGETGASWTKAPSETDTLVVDSGSNVLTGSGLYYASGTPAGAEYDVEADVYTGGAGFRGAEIYGRGSDSAETYYRASWHRGNEEYQLHKCVAGTFTALGTWAFTAENAVHTMKLEIRDATKRVYVDGTERISSTDNAITDAGLVGVGAFSANADNAHLVSVTATDVAGGGLSIPVGTVSFNLDPGTSLGVLRELVPVPFNFSPQALTAKTEIVLSLGAVEFPLAPQTLNPSIGSGQTIPLGVVSFNLSPQDIAWQRLRDLGVVQFPFSARPLGVSGGEAVGEAGSTAGITSITDIGTI